MAYIPTEKIARLREKAARLEAQARPKMAEWESHRGDHAFMFQPAGRGSTFGRQRQRVLDRYDKGLKLLEEARELRERADHLERFGIPEKGDAEKRRQRRRDALDDVITVGSRVVDPIGGYGTVLKVNKKTLRVQYDRGFTWTEDKSRYRLLVGEPDTE